ncbi:MAG: hypothetical protein V7720_17330 [Halioglobus sp.]
MILIALVVAAIASLLDVGPLDGLLRTIVASALTIFVAWALLTVPYFSTLGSASSATHLLQGKTRRFEYRLEESGVLETSDGKTKLFRYSDFVGEGKYGGGMYLAFKMGLIYFPVRVISAGDLDEFNKSFQQRLAD